MLSAGCERGSLFWIANVVEVSEDEPASIDVSGEAFEVDIGPNGDVALGTATVGLGGSARRAL